jgi:hypothetical protein
MHKQRKLAIPAGLGHGLGPEARNEQSLERSVLAMGVGFLELLVRCKGSLPHRKSI